MKRPVKKECILDYVCASSIWSVGFLPGTLVRGIRKGACAHVFILDSPAMRII